jgi:hypothetical protein
VAAAGKATGPEEGTGPEAGRVRLLILHPPPLGYLPGWPPAKPAPRCGCGAWITARSSRFTACWRGCVSLTPRALVVTPELVKARGNGHAPADSRSAKKQPPKTAKKPPKKAKVTPAPLTPEQERFRRLLAPVRLMEYGFVQDQRRGRPASAGSVALAIVALHRFREACPAHGPEIAAALPWLSRRAAREARP